MNALVMAELPAAANSFPTIGALRRLVVSVERTVVVLEMYLTMTKVLSGGNELLLLLLDFSTALVMSLKQAVEALGMSLTTTDLFTLAVLLV